MENIEIRLDPETALRMLDAKRKFVIEFFGSDYLKERAAADFLEKKKAHERKRTID